MNNEFERFLKENADQHRLYPSSRVWRGIYAALHSPGKWYGLGITLLLVTSSLIALLITQSSKETAILANKPAENNQISVPAVPRATPEKMNPDESHYRHTSFTGKSQITSTPIIFYSRPENIINDLTGIKQNVSYNETGSGVQDLFSSTIIDDFSNLEMPASSSVLILSKYHKKLSGTNPFNWTIESVLNSFTPLAPRTKRFSLQFNFTPTISYRKLSENKSFLRSAASQPNPTAYTAFYDINSAVTHKPDMGLEVGLTSKYSLATNFRVKAGLQFNINRYDIRAFNYPLEVARISLRDGNAGVQSVYTISTHRNFGGYKSDWLQNFYFEVSLPVGIEVNLVGDEKVQFGVGGSIQPTYVLTDRAYLLSTDYKNYAEVPWLIRRWNASTAVETFVSYSTGRMKWQVGPQVRYQLLSSFVDKYPVKENLFDFGLKVGISVNKSNQH